MINKIKNILRQTIFYKLYKKYKALFYKTLYMDPAKGMIIIGVTGTDGKTTTVNLIHKILNDNLGPTAAISTALIKIGNEILENNKKMTSFDPKDLYRLLSIAKSRGIKYVVLEVSSHALDQYRFEGIDFNIGVLTNISPEHLDYHRTFENYIETKKKLFLNIALNENEIKGAVLPKDDEVGRKWIEELAIDKIIDYGILTSATLKAENIVEKIYGLEFDIKYLLDIYKVEIPNLKGKFNVYNVLAAIGVGLILKIDIKDILNSLKNFEGVPGRLQLIEKDGKKFFVDFAHTPKALESVLNYLQNIKGNGDIYVVFGAPGNRDKFKRSKMGEIVSKFSDYFVITDDDPDTEDRYFIISQVWDGVGYPEGKKYWVIPEREKAIKFIKTISNKGDIILLAGKGHENVQLTNFGKKNYSDIEHI